MEHLRPKQDDVTLLGLVTKVKEISGLMPVLKQVVSQQIDINCRMDRVDEISQHFLTQVNLDVEWQRQQSAVHKLVKERLEKQDEAL